MGSEDKFVPFTFIEDDGVDSDTISGDSDSEEGRIIPNLNSSISGEPVEGNVTLVKTTHN